jgi:hypothetical protein
MFLFEREGGLAVGCCFANIKDIAVGERNGGEGRVRGGEEVDAIEGRERGKKKEGDKKQRKTRKRRKEGGEREGKSLL